MEQVPDVERIDMVQILAPVETGRVPLDSELTEILLEHAEGLLAAKGVTVEMGRYAATPQHPDGMAFSVREFECGGRRHLLITAVGDRLSGQFEAHYDGGREPTMIATNAHLLGKILEVDWLAEAPRPSIGSPELVPA